MICKHCGNAIGKDAIFCPKCGEKNAKEDVEAEEGSKEIVAENDEPKKKFPFKIIISVLVGVLLLAGGWFWMTSSANKPQKDRLLYIKDNEIYFLDFDGQDGKKEKPKLIAEKLIDKNSSDFYGRNILKSFAERHIYFTADGKTLFYPDKNEYQNNELGVTIFFKKLKEDKAEAKKLDSEITKYFVLDDSNKSKIFYLKGKDGNFYQNDFNDNRVKIAADVKDFWINSSGNNILYINKDGDIYLVDAKGNKDKIDSGSKIVSVKDNLNKIYYTKDKSLYFKNSGKDREQIAKDVSDVVRIYDSGEIYFAKAEETKTKLINLVEDDLQAADAGVTAPQSPRQPYPQQFYTWPDYYRALDDYRVAQNSYYDAMWKYNAKQDREHLRDVLNREEITKVQKTLCYYDGKTVANVTEDFSYTQATGDNAVIVYTNKISKSNGNNAKIKISALSAYDSVYSLKMKIMKTDPKASTEYRFAAVKGKAFELSTNKPSNFHINPSSTKIYFIDDYNLKEHKGTLYEIKIENGAVGNPVKVDDEVASTYHFTTGWFNTDGGIKNDSIIYFKNYKNGKADLYMDKVFIDSDVSTANQIKRIGNSKKVVYYTDWSEDKQFGMLKLHDGEKSKKISSETNQFYVLSDGRILYLDNFDIKRQKGDIYFYNGTDEKRQIDTDVTSILYY